MCVNGRANEVAVSESHEISWVAYLGQITSIGSGCPQYIIKGVLPRGDGILASAIGRANEVASSEYCEIGRVAYLG